MCCHNPSCNCASVGASGSGSARKANPYPYFNVLFNLMKEQGGNLRAGMYLISCATAVWY